MSAFETAERRLMDALARLEAAIVRLPRPDAIAAATAELETQRDVLERDCDLLRAECDRLRRELDALQARHARLEEAARAADEQLGATIGAIEEILRS